MTVAFRLIRELLVLWLVIHILVSRIWLKLAGNVKSNECWRLTIRCAAIARMPIVRLLTHFAVILAHVGLHLVLGPIVRDHAAGRQLASRQRRVSTPMRLDDIGFAMTAPDPWECQMQGELHDVSVVEDKLLLFLHDCGIGFVLVGRSKDGVYFGCGRGDDTQAALPIAGLVVAAVPVCTVFGTVDLVIVAAVLVLDLARRSFAGFGVPNVDGGGRGVRHDENKRTRGH